jgi:glycerol-3-phosphate acyltransferase PlsY
MASAFVFHQNLGKLGKGNKWLSNFKRLYGFRGFLELLMVEVFKDLLPIFIGGWLLGIKGHADAGRAFAMFCIVLGRLYPANSEFKGSHASFALAIGTLTLNTSTGGAALVVMLLVSWFSRYLSLGAVAEAAITMMVAVLVVDDDLILRLIVFTSLLIIFKHIPALVRIIKGREYRFSLEEDITYKFDQRF